LIDDQLRIEGCDILIGVFWKRFGTAVGDAESGTAHESRRAMETWKDKGTPEVMLYFREVHGQTSLQMKRTSFARSRISSNSFI